MLELIRPALRAAFVFLAHTVLAMLSALGVKGFEYLWSLLYSEHEPMVAGLFPMRYIFEVGEAGVFAVFIIFGIWEAVKAFLSERPSPN
jgi:hypothetical protein